MKRNIFLFASALILAMALSAYAVFTGNTSRDNHEIAVHWNMVQNTTLFKDLDTIMVAMVEV